MPGDLTVDWGFFCKFVFPRTQLEQQEQQVKFCFAYQILRYEEQYVPDILHLCVYYVHSMHFGICKFRNVSLIISIQLHISQGVSDSNLHHFQRLVIETENSNQSSIYMQVNFPLNLWLQFAFRVAEERDTLASRIYRCNDEQIGEKRVFNFVTSRKTSPR